MHAPTVSILSSGSCGNSTLVSAGDESVLIDAGISCRELERRLSFFGADVAQIAAVVLTHEHTDHVRGARRFCAEHGIPTYGTRGTLALTPLNGIDTVTFAHSKPFTIGSFTFEPFKVKHHAAEPVAFSVGVASRKVGIASDLGCVTPGVVGGLRGSDLLIVEANYDERMLMEGTYPRFLRRTIMGDHGHLSNNDAGALSSKAATKRTGRIILVHLSKENNSPDIARRTVEAVLDENHQLKPLEVAEHGLPCGPFGLN